MTAWEDIQFDWATQTENNNITGVLLWDLSAAFDMLDSEIFCRKIALYGFQPQTIKWFVSFLTDKSQKVKIGSSLSRPINLQSGVPQGGVISPLIFVLYVSDLDLWLKWSSAKTYADDTTTGTSHKLLSTMLKRLEEDAASVLSKEFLHIMFGNALIFKCVNSQIT